MRGRKRGPGEGFKVSECRSPSQTLGPGVVDLVQVDTDSSEDNTTRRTSHQGTHNKER